MLFPKNLRIKVNIFKKQYPPVIIWNKNLLSKQDVPIICSLEVGQSFLFWQSKKKLAVYFGLYESSSEFQGREDQISIAWIKFIWQSVDSWVEIYHKK